MGKDITTKGTKITLKRRFGFRMLTAKNAKYAKPDRIFHHEGHAEHENNILADGSTAQCS